MTMQSSELDFTLAFRGFHYLTAAWFGDFKECNYPWSEKDITQDTVAFYSDSFSASRLRYPNDGWLPTDVFGSEIDTLLRADYRRVLNEISHRIKGNPVSLLPLNEGISSTFLNYAFTAERWALERGTKSINSRFPNFYLNPGREFFLLRYADPERSQNHWLLRKAGNGNGGGQRKKRVLHGKQHMITAVTPLAAVCPDLIPYLNQVRARKFAFASKMYKPLAYRLSGERFEPFNYRWL